MSSLLTLKVILKQMSGTIVMYVPVVICKKEIRREIITSLMLSHAEVTSLALISVREVGNTNLKTWF